MIYDPHPPQAHPATRTNSARRLRAAVRGFTITEMMVTIAVLVIIVGLATPSFREIILSQGVKTASFDVFAGLILARSEAVSRNTTVTITPSGGNWSEGWVIADSGGEVVKRQDRRASPTTAPGASPPAGPPSASWRTAAGSRMRAASALI
jgi:type IV fimbrial biogenesis protein FimT